jgi:asparagine synthetase B (glutamine-hydrolysing)
VNFYDSFSGFAKVEDITEAALRALSRVHGSFAFVVYDSLTKRVWAARDADGVQPLYWGVTGAGASEPSCVCRHLYACRHAADCVCPELHRLLAAAGHRIHQGC